MKDEAKVRVVKLVEELRSVDRVKLAKQLEEKRLQAEREPPKPDACTNETMRLYFGI